ncbi:type IV secretory system conjugative DNA transfer family protein [Macrococcus capreoli]
MKNSSDLDVRKQVIEKRKAPFDPRKYLGNIYVLGSLFITTLLVFAIVLNWLINVVSITTTLIFKKLSSGDFSNIESTNQAILATFKNLNLWIVLNPYLLVYLLLLFIIMCFLSFKFYQLYTRYRTIEYGQHGDSRFTTKEELDEQYKKVPHVLDNYEGKSGFPISHYKHWYYVCVDAFNTLIIGTSRSGKGVTSVIPSIDIDSRASEQPSLVIGDPKGELAGASYETLIRRGYDVQILNIENPSRGMSYNPLYLIAKYYKRGDLDSAQKYCKSLTHTLFHDPKVNDQTWNKFASSTTQAIILAIVDYCIKNNEEEKITMRNVYNMLLTYAGYTYVDKKTQEERSKLDDYMETLAKQNPQHPAVIAYGTVQFSKSKTRSSIFTTVSEKLDDINKDGIARMMSRNTVDFKRIGFNKYVQLKMDKTHQFRKGKFIVKDEVYEFELDETGYTEINFNKELDTYDEVFIEINEKKYTIKTQRVPVRNKLGIPKRNEFTKEIEINNWLELDYDNAAIEEVKIHYTAKPIAIFMVIPDYDTSEHFVASLFVSQLYTELSRESSRTKGLACFTRVKFRLDEFGNLPAIENMSGNLTVCLGRNILFELYVQELEQIESKYSKEEAKTIISNCQNKVYIKSTSDDTTELISKLAGEKTVESISHSAGRNSIDINESRSVEKKRLITPDELREFVMGETLVLRPLKTRDMKNNDVRPYPILNSGKFQMPRAFETINDQFNTKNELSKYNIPSAHKSLDLMVNNLDFTHMMKSNGGYDLKSYISASKHGLLIYNHLSNYIITTFDLMDDLEFRRLCNQENQRDFYAYLKRLCESHQKNYEDTKYEVNEIISSGDTPVEGKFVKTSKEDDLIFMNEKAYSKLMFEEIKSQIDNSNLKSADKEFLKNEATIRMARDILQQNNLDLLFETSMKERTDLEENEVG